MLTLAVLMLLVCGANLQAATAIKIGSIAPGRSPWDKALNELAADWEKISNGSVQVKIYAGGIAGNELDMIRKMRLGTLGGAVLTNMGMTKISRDLFVLSTPFLTDSEQEFQYVFEKMKPVLQKQIEEKGFKVLLWTEAGWAYFFTKDKILYPEDLKEYKISFAADEPEMEQAWKKMGYQVVPNDLKDMMMALQSGMVNAFYLSPLVAGSGQYFALAPHMLALRLAPLVGGLVLTDKAWESIPEQYREPMVQSVLKAAEDLYQTTKGLEDEALKAMKENGLIIHEPPADAMEKWRAAASKGMDELTAKAFSKEIYDQVLSIIQEFRQKSGR
jgi:TRAP-type C4-dicarboxylate transport system substrate-binding protein